MRVFAHSFLSINWISKIGTFTSYHIIYMTCKILQIMKEKKNERASQTYISQNFKVRFSHGICDGNN